MLSGGELAAMVVADAVLRKLPGALGHADRALEESFSRGARGATRSTRTTRAPPSTAAGAVPDVLLSGHHAEIGAVAARPHRRSSGRATAGGGPASA